MRPCKLWHPTKSQANVIFNRHRVTFERKNVLHVFLHKYLVIPVVTKYFTNTCLFVSCAIFVVKPKLPPTLPHTQHQH